MSHRIWFLIICIVASCADLLTKHLWAWEGINKELIPGLLRFRYTENPGIIFGSFPEGRVFFLILSILAVPILIVIFWSIKRPGTLVTLSLALILGGNLGNMHDRIAYGVVRDFIDFYLIGWPLFNLADSFICVGIGIILIYLLFFEKRAKTSQKG